MVFTTSIRGQIRWFAVLLTVFICFPVVSKADPIILSKNFKTLKLGSLVDYVEDKKGDLTLGDILPGLGGKDDETVGREKLDWKKTEKKSLSFGYTDSVYWLKCDFVNADEEARSYFVEVAYPVIDHVSMTLIRKKGVEHCEMGDKLPFFTRPVEHRNFLFPLSLAPKEQVTLVVRVKTTSSMQIPLFIHNERYFMEKDQTVMMGLGFYYGSMIIMILYNLFVYFSIREANYLYYVFYVVSMTLFLTSLNGTSYHYLWPESMWWNDQVLVVSLNGVVIFGVLFTAGFLKLKQARPISYRIFMVFAFISMGIVLFSYKIPYKIGILSTIVMAMFAIFWCMIATFIRWFEGFASARFYAMAWFAMLSGGVILALNKVGLIPRNIFTENATQYGAILEVVLLSFALADRLNLEKKERIEAQNLAHIQERNARIANENALLNERRAREAREQAFIIQKKAKETLEQKVEERTYELKETLDAIKEANQHILSSLRYARMIQLSMLPQDERISEIIPEHFIWWQPRDIVGGDFYYIDVIDTGYIVAVADCTGHGVPGAFMTLISGSELRRIVKGEKCYDPGEILKRMNRRIRKALKQDSAAALSNDGLDIGVCVVKSDEKTVYYAGARMDMIYTSDDDIHMLHGNKNSVGYVSSSSDDHYTAHAVAYEDGMTIYLGTDGIMDQLGDDTGRRFGTRRLKDLIARNRNEPMDVQYERLKSALEEHKKERDQVDDMTMVAFKTRG